MSVSYTHLDVYKRQTIHRTKILFSLYAVRIFVLLTPPIFVRRFLVSTSLFTEERFLLLFGTETLSGTDTISTVFKGLSTATVIMPMLSFFISFSILFHSEPFAPFFGLGITTYTESVID